MKILIFGSSGLLGKNPQAANQIALNLSSMTFMVAMGTSLADRAWGSESAVYRVAGVLNVIAELPINKTGIFRNKTFMFTGKLEGMSRAEAKSLIEKNSGKIISNVNKKLDYLIIGEKPTTKKVNLAKGLKISIFNQNQWLEMLKSTD